MFQCIFNVVVLKNKLDKKVLNNLKLALKDHLGHRKMESIVKKVLLPYTLEIVLNDIVENVTPFSISIDASNTGNRKFFPFAIIYFDINEGVKYRILDFYEKAG